MTDKKNLTVDQKTIERLATYHEAMAKQITRQNRWKKENRTQILLVVKPEEKERWKTAAAAAGQSLQAYIVSAIEARITAAETITDKENENHDSNNTITGQADTQSSAQGI